MIKIGFGNSIKPKTFGYIPRFYDPDKEELKERLKKYQEPASEEEAIDQMKKRIKTGIRFKHYGDSTSRSSYARKSNIRVFYIIFILGVLSYILLSSNKITSLIEAFSK
ncbi:MAG: hypothetical protein IPL08_08800 [Saprospiraceae bacterium]|nr:hypothetical protein [Saprospiraceae bacterium]MBK8669487.1 hypothetical protein [Saprospiraceae bacterium]MBL0098907.1 hypothetical protein [Saprospiraceae bacterium]